MIDRLRHPDEGKYFKLAVVATTPLLLIGLVLVVASMGSLLLAVVLVLPMIWFSIKLLEAQFKANLVKVSDLNFPEVKAIIDEAREKLDYRPDVDAYVKSGNANMFLYKFFRTKMLVINSEFIDAASRDELVWLVGRFIGSLKAKHDRLTVLTALVGISEKLGFLNLLLYPYERAVVHSADQMGLYLSGDLKAALTALNRMIVGKDLHRHVTIEGLLAQKREIDGQFLPSLVRLFSTHPHMVDRHANMLRFAAEHMPEARAAYDAGSTVKPKLVFKAAA